MRPFAAVLLATFLALAAAAEARDPAPLAMPTTGPASPVPEWSDFCRRFPSQCRAGKTPDEVVRFDAATLRTLASVNRIVNRNVREATDPAHWGVEEHWDLPIDGSGDCEDYALEKRRLLIERGFPRSALAIAIAWTVERQGHSVLLVRTEGGDIVLDDGSDEVRFWCETDYRFVKRQSNTDESEWVSLYGEAKPNACRLDVP